MVERLCRDYGTPILHSTPPMAPAEAEMPEEEQKAVPDLAFYAFPTLEQLSAASEADLRAQGFGYRYRTVMPKGELGWKGWTTVHGLLEHFSQ